MKFQVNYNGDDIVVDAHDMKELEVRMRSRAVTERGAHTSWWAKGAFLDGQWRPMSYYWQTAPSRIED